MKISKFFVNSLAIFTIAFLISGISAEAKESIVNSAEDQMPSRNIDGAYWYNAVWEINDLYAEKTRVVADRTLPARSFFIPSKREEDALIPQYDWREKENWQSLNGLWNFKLVARPDQVIEDFHELDFAPDSSWMKLEVPSSWQLKPNNIDDEPIYSNWYYPWTQAGYVKIGAKANVIGEELNYATVAKATAPKNYNPVGHYIREFYINEENKDDNVILNFQGVESAFYVYVNGNYVGYSEDSFTQHEFDITKFVNKEGANKIAVLVYRWSDGSLLENQDLVNYSGIFRDTGLIYRNSEAALYDFTNDITVYDGEAIIKTDYKLSAGAKKAGIRIYDENDNLVAEADANALDGGFESIVTLYDPELWSPEHPYLYKEVLLVYDENDNVTEYIGQNLGIREVKLVQVANGKTSYALNGKSIVFKGVNRHELDNDHGRAVRIETIKKDLELMKQNNVNSIRTSHYPNCIDLYILADYYGIMIMDEANMETHAAGGLAGIPMAVETFRYPSIHRAANMYERDKNFTSVVAWSNGNECIFFAPPAVNDKYSFRLMYKYIKDRDPKRPIVLERDTRVGISDIRSRMYWPASEHSIVYSIFENIAGNDKDVLESADERPYLQVEYAHSMGNSLGYYKEYWDLWRKYEHAMGGFIWDWVDQSPLWDIPAGEEATGPSYDDYGNKVASGGSKYYAYGGDWAMDKNNNSDNFMDNGLISSDRIPHDSRAQMKHVQQDILFTNYDKNSNTVDIKNEFGFINLSELDFKIRLFEDGILKEESPFYVNIEARSEQNVELPSLDYTKDESKEYSLVISAHLRDDANDTFNWADAGYEIAFGEFVLTDFTEYKTVEESSSDLENSVRQDENVLVVENENLYFELEKESLQWTRFTKDNIDFFANDPVKFYTKKGSEMNSGMYANFWRAPVDNDRQNKWLSRVNMWRESNFDRLNGNVVVNEDDKTKTIITVDSTLKNLSKLQEIYTIYSDGHINYYQHIDPIFASKEIPSIGTMFELSDNFNRLSYYGRGPATTFVDRWEGYKLGIYDEIVDFNSLGNYVKPQENGNHFDVRWAEILDNNDNGLIIKAKSGALEVMASPYNQYDVTDKTHPYKLLSTNTTYLRVSHKNAGVGGENSWGARPLPYAEIEAKEYEFSYDIFPVVNK